MQAYESEEIFAEIQSIDDPQQRREKIEAYIQSLPDDSRTQFIFSLEHLPDEELRAQILRISASKLPEAERSDALHIAKRIRSDAARLYALLGFVPYVPPPMIHEILLLATSIEEESARVEAFSVLAPRLNDDELALALKSVEEFGSLTQRFNGLIALLPSLPESSQYPARQEALGLAREIAEPSSRALALNAIVPHIQVDLQSDVQHEILTLLDRIDDEQQQTSILCQLTAPLPEKVQDEALAAARKIRQPALQARAVKHVEALQRKTTEIKTEEKHTTVATHLHSDQWTLDDKLGYSLYAKAIAEFIRHDDTRPPLTVGILAPWGQGKTTLMHLVEHHLRTTSESPSGSVNRDPSSTGQQQRSTTFRDLVTWLRERATPQPQKLRHPTIWFNAWKYQNSEQVWAGMADCILSQLVEQLPDPVEREKFWLALQAERLDFQAIRQDIQHVILERVLPNMVRWLMASIGGFALLLFGTLTAFIEQKLLSWGGGITLSGLISLLFGFEKIWRRWLTSKTEIMNTPLEGTFTKYVRQPDYSSKQGLFCDVERDVKKVFNLLIDPAQPAIIFVDDLDRCSPDRVAEVIEAINLFLSGDFPSCYFVVGLDAQVVAASMEVAHEELTKKLQTMTRNYGSFGWYFMDKFLQLKFIIPNMTTTQQREYLSHLFQVPLKPEELDGIDDVERRVERVLRDQQTRAKDLPEQIARDLSTLRKARPDAFQRFSHEAIELGAQQFSDNDPEIQAHLLRYHAYLGTNPRTMKLFANLYRFYRAIQWSRDYQGLPTATQAALGRWLVIMLRWPTLVRWIQWENESQLVDESTPYMKAQTFEQLADDATSYDAWKTTLHEADRNQFSALIDKQLFEFLRHRQDEGERLCRAVEVGMW